MKALGLLIKGSTPFLLSFALVVTVFGGAIDTGVVLKDLLAHVPSLLYSGVSIISAVIGAYFLSRRVAFFKSSALPGLSSVLTSVPVFVLAIFLQSVLWLRIFRLVSYHDPIKDFFSTFIPTFSTIFLFSFLEISLFMRPIAERILKSEFVRTMRSIGEDERTVRKKLARNIDVEFSRILIHLTPIFMGESIVVERIYNFRGVGYELVEAMKNLDLNSVIALSVHFSLITTSMGLFSWVVGERWREG